jgi:hypothetical protein
MMSSLDTFSPVAASTLAYLMRWPVFLLIWLKETFSLSDVAGNSATAQVTKDSRRKPFPVRPRRHLMEIQYARQRLNRPIGLGFQAGQLVNRTPGTYLLRVQDMTYGGDFVWRQACQRLLAGEPWRLFRGVGIGPVLSPAVLVAFVDRAGLPQKADRLSVYRREVQSPVSRQHLAPSSDGESAEPAVCSPTEAETGVL